jgi:hypothetical protein
LTIIQKSYPTFFKDFDPETAEIQARLWQRSLADCNYRDVVNAFEIWLNTEKYPPTLAEFKPIVVKFRNPSAFQSPERAWETVTIAVRKYGSYNSERAFETFSEPIKRAVRYVGGWQKICQTELGRDWDFLRKNFVEAYKDFGQDEKEQELLPASVLHRLQEMTGEKKQERLESK